MTLKQILQKDYILLLLLSVLYFLAIKSVLPAFIYLICALLTSFYFFPIKLFLGSALDKNSSSKRIIVLLSYFVIGNIIALTALIAFQSDLDFIRTAIFIYGLVNLAFLIYYHFTESGSYNFMLTVCTVILTSAVIGFS